MEGHHQVVFAHHRPARIEHACRASVNAGVFVKVHREEDGGLSSLLQGVAIPVAGLDGHIPEVVLGLGRIGTGTDVATVQERPSGDEQTRGGDHDGHGCRSNPPGAAAPVDLGEDPCHPLRRRIHAGRLSIEQFVDITP